MIGNRKTNRLKSFGFFGLRYLFATWHLQFDRYLWTLHYTCIAYDTTLGIVKNHNASIPIRFPTSNRVNLIASTHSPTPCRIEEYFQPTQIERELKVFSKEIATLGPSPTLISNPGHGARASKLSTLCHRSAFLVSNSLALHASRATSPGTRRRQMWRALQRRTFCCKRSVLRSNPSLVSFWL